MSSLFVTRGITDERLKTSFSHLLLQPGPWPDTDNEQDNREENCCQVEDEDTSEEVREDRVDGHMLSSGLEQKGIQLYFRTSKNSTVINLEPLLFEKETTSLPISEKKKEDSIKHIAPILALNNSKLRILLYVFSLR